MRDIEPAYTPLISVCRDLEELQRQAANARKQSKFTLWNLLSERSELDEPQFHDAVQRRLSAGHLMVLIIGDGITEGAEVGLIRFCGQLS